MDNSFKKIAAFAKRWLLLSLVMCFIAAFLYFDLQQYLSFNAIKQHREQLLLWRDQHLITLAITYMIAYTLIVACSIPGATFLTLLGGFLFGLLIGSVLVVFSATLGALIIFLAVQLAFRDWFTQKAVRWLAIMEKGFKENAFAYLLFLRLVPLFPFWLVNIVPALLGVPKKTYVIATFLGIIPGSVIYVWVGRGLGYVLDTNQSPNLAIIFDPQILLPLIALGCLALLPVIYRRYWKRV